VADYFAAQYRTTEQFLDITTFQVFADLYYENFAEYFPFLHVSRLEQDGVHWILLLAVAAIGAQYSSLRSYTAFAKTLQDLFLRAADEFFPSFPSTKDLTWAQIFLLRDICATLNGGKSMQVKRQFEKHKLLTFCRALAVGELADAYTARDDKTSQDGEQQTFDKWLEEQSRLRVLHGAYFLECLQFVLQDLQPGLQLEDLVSAMPCHDDLWHCRGESDWNRLRAERPELFSTPLGYSNASSSWDRTESSGYSTRLLFLYVYVEERLTLERLRSTPIRRVLFSHVSLTPSEEQWPGLGSRVLEDPRGILSSVSASAGDEMNRLFALVPSEISVSAALTTPQDVIFQLLLVLRDVPLRMLLAYSGWQANDLQMGCACSNLTMWMTRQQQSARRVLHRAAIIFSGLREKRVFGPYDAFALLTAALYIWGFDRLIPPGLHRPRHSGDEELRPATLRLERSTDARANERWVELGGPACIFIPGVGVLNGEESPKRVLQELARILMSRTEWSVACQVIGRAVLHMLEQQRPHFDEDVLSDEARDDTDVVAESTPSAR
jgi:hypothetical protein